MQEIGQRRTTPVATALRLWRLLFDTGRRRTIRVLVLNAFAGLAEGAGVLALAPVLKLLGIGEADASGAASDPHFILALVGYVGLVAAAAAVIRQRGIAIQELSLEFLDRLRGDLHAAILAMEWSRFRALRIAELQQTVFGEIGRISHAVNLSGQLAGAVLTMPFVLGASLLLSWPLTLGALFVTAAVVVLTRRLGAESFRLGRQLGEINRAAMADLADDLAGFRIIKSFGAEAARASGTAARFAAIRRNQLAHQRTQATERAALQAVAAVAAAAALYLAVAVLRTPLADALVLILAYGRLLQTALRSLSTWRQLTGAVAAVASYDETLALCRAAVEPAPTTGVAAPYLRQAIRLSGVGVVHGSAPGAPAALDGIDGEIPAGRLTAVVGPSGAGKTTLVDLVAGLTKPDSGEIYIDDLPLTGELRSGWRRQVSVVPQDPFLFHDTIAANLRLANDGAGDDALWDALDAAAVGDFVRSLPNGLKTVVGDRGARLSGGERQRIVLARALLRQPALLVLDEATASLDGATEALVAGTLAELRGSCTVLVVAHRPSTVRAADHVLFLEAGRMIAAGSWEEVRRVAGLRLAALGLLE